MTSQSNGKLSGKRVVVIGGTSGIGLAVAAGALEEGAEVRVGSSQEAKIERARAHLSGQVSGETIDVQNEASIRNFFDKVELFDHLVYTAGDWGHRVAQNIASTTIEQFDRALTVRFFGALLATKHGVPKMRKGGSITFTGGMVAHRPRKGAPLSTAMAGSIEHLTYGLAIDLAPIRVNAVCPGVIGTAVWGEDASEKFRTMTDPLPLPRVGEPDEVAEAYLYLMKGGYTTGQILWVDGGRSLT